MFSLERKHEYNNDILSSIIYYVRMLYLAIAKIMYDSYVVIMIIIIVTASMALLLEKLGVHAELVRGILTHIDAFTDKSNNKSIHT